MRVSRRQQAAIVHPTWSKLCACKQTHGKTPVQAALRFDPADGPLRCPVFWWFKPPWFVPSSLSFHPGETMTVIYHDTYTYELLLPTRRSAAVIRGSTTKPQGPHGASRSLRTSLSSISGIAVYQSSVSSNHAVLMSGLPGCSTSVWVAIQLVLARFDL
jgi:hypothetical protein